MIFLFFRKLRNISHKMLSAAVVIGASYLLKGDTIKKNTKKATTGLSARRPVSMAFCLRVDNGPSLNLALWLCDFPEDIDQYCLGIL